MSVLAAFIGQLFGSFFGSWKMFLGVGFLSCAAVGLYNLFGEIVSDVLGWVTIKTSDVSGSFQGPGVMQVIGLGAYLLEQLKIPQCMSFIINAIILKWMLRKIPFIRW